VLFFSAESNFFIAKMQTSPPSSPPPLAPLKSIVYVNPQRDDGVLHWDQQCPCQSRPLFAVSLKEWWAKRIHDARPVLVDVCHGDAARSNPNLTSTNTLSPASSSYEAPSEPSAIVVPDTIVYINANGSDCYHSNKSHAGKTVLESALTTALQCRLRPCKRCYPNTSTATAAATLSSSSVVAVTKTQSSAQPLYETEATYPAKPRIFFFDLEGQFRPRKHRADTRSSMHQIAIHSLDGSVVWSRVDIEEKDIPSVWDEWIRQINGDGDVNNDKNTESSSSSSMQRPSIWLFAHNAKRFDQKLLEALMRDYQLSLPAHMHVVDTLPLIRSWLEQYDPRPSSRRYNLTALTYMLLRRDAQESNLAMIEYWQGKEAGIELTVDRLKAHQAAYDACVLRLVFILSFLSFAQKELVYRNNCGTEALQTMHVVLKRVLKHSHHTASICKNPKLTCDAALAAWFDRIDRSTSS
jgi:hypothetical protein